jgi:3-phosphoshikimate 1-carboxyvinyltransferase
MDPMNDLRREIHPIGPIRVIAEPPGSKSLTNRALLCAALADGESTISNALVSDDTRYMVAALRTLGLVVEESDNGTNIRVIGEGGRFPVGQASLSVGNAGTAMRFLTAALAASQGKFSIDGDPRMRERPIGDLIDGLKQLGAGVRARDGRYPPVEITGLGLRGGSCEIDGRISSQFVSAILMAAPYSVSDVTLRVKGELVSQPYVAMTRRVMSDFGVDVESTRTDRYTIRASQCYQAAEYAVEPDASAASYWFSAAAVTGGTVRVEGLGTDSVQGDMGFVRLLEEMGCRVRHGSDWTEVTGGPLRGIETDMRHISDTAMTLAAVALFADGPTRIGGIANVRVKESDRIAAVAMEAGKLGAEVEELPDGMVIHPGDLHGAEIETYNDHRIAMSFAVVGLVQPGVVILDPGCVSKTYPSFFDDLASMGA